jgi:uncharacterized Zn finger protein (UPF0148 family)
MALLKRRKRKLPKALAKRQLLCGECGTPILADDFPDTAVDYSCPKCGASSPRTVEQENRKQLQAAATEARAQKKRTALEQRKSAGLPAIWVEPLRTTPQQRAQAREDERRGAREIAELLSKDSHPPPRGRKADPDYDKAAYRLKLAELRGKRIPMDDLADATLPVDKSGRGYKRDKVRQAIKRRAKNR